MRQSLTTYEICPSMERQQMTHLFPMEPAPIRELDLGGWNREPGRHYTLLLWANLHVGDIAMKLSLDLRGIPEPIAQALEQLVAAIRQQTAATAPNERPLVEFPVWEGRVIEPLSRADLYEEHLDRKFPPRDTTSGSNEGTSEPHT